MSVASTCHGQPHQQLSLIPPYACPFCPPEAKAYRQFAKYREHFQARHSGLCPICMTHFKQLGLHYWNAAIRQGREDHMIAMVSYYHSTGKCMKNRMRLAAYRQKVISNWAHYTAAAARKGGRRIE